MTATSEQKPNPDTRYVKQGEPKGDFASGERTTSTIPKVEDFASGEHTLPTAPENPDLVQAIPPVLIVPDQKA